MRTYLSVVAAAASLAAGCDSGHLSSSGTVGTLRVVLATTGGDQDLDGYNLILDGVQQRQVPANGVVLIEDLAAGPHTLAVDQVAENCDLAGEQPVRATIAPGKETRITVSVGCFATGVQIRIATMGSDLDLDGYSLTLGAGLELPLPPNATIVRSRLASGNYPLSLDGVGAHCMPDANNPSEVTVISRSLVTISLGVVCGRTGRIAFTHYEYELPLISTVYADGSSPVQLTEGYSPAWSPDGSKLVFTRDRWFCGTECSTGLFVLDLNDQQITRLTTQVDDMAAWSPDGSRIAFIRGTRLYLLKADGSSETSLDELPISSAASPAWSPDGIRLAFTCLVVNYEICVVNTDGTGFTRITKGMGQSTHPAWHPDGSRIAFTNRPDAAGPGAASEIMSVKTDGSGLTRITTGADPSWSPDGTQLVIFDRGRLALVNADGSGIRQLTSGGDFDPSWRPN